MSTAGPSVEGFILRRRERLGGTDMGTEQGKGEQAVAE